MSRGLFRLVTAHDLDVATREQWVVNWGGGNGPYKRFRGAEPMFEYDIVFDRHLRADRRLPWWLLQHGRARKNGAPLTPSPHPLVPDGAGSPAPARVPMTARIALVTSNPRLVSALLQRHGRTGGGGISRFRSPSGSDRRCGFRTGCGICAG